MVWTILGVAPVGAAAGAIVLILCIKKACMAKNVSIYWYTSVT